MKSTMRIMFSILIMLIILPHIASAGMMTCIYGVKINLKNGKELNGYVLVDLPINSCKKSREITNTWDSFLENNSNGGPITFIGKLVRIKKQQYDPEFFAAKSSMKEIKIDEIKSIKGVCRKWSDTWVSGYAGVPIITDYMAEYVTNNKMVAAYTFDHEDVPPEDEDYSYSACTTYFSYNPEYPRERLMKQRKLIDKMSEDTLDKNKLIRFIWAYD